jgi:hypothetical protein
MHEHDAPLQGAGQADIALPQVTYPDRRINKDHLDDVFRRAGTSRSG